MKKIYVIIIALFFCFSAKAQPTRNWGTYYGETGLDRGTAVAVDLSGNVYITGFTSSTTGMSTAGSHQSTFGGGVYDAYLVKFNSAGVRQWATYYGGADFEQGHAVVCDAAGNVYIAGLTQSSSSISTAGSHQPVFAGGTDGGTQDVFIVKFNSAGVRQWASYYGGTGADEASTLGVDPISGNVYLGGLTTTVSGTAISTPGSHQPTWGTASQNAFLAAFSSSGVRQWGTYYGSTGFSNGNFISVDGTGNVYFSGYTNSTASISSVGCHQSTLGGGYDAFVVKFNSAGVRQWGTYYGGTLDDFGYSAVADPISGNIYVCGRASSTSAISTAGSHQPIYGGGTNDVFLAAFNSSGVRQWATYYGGTIDDRNGFASVDGTGTVYIGGRTNSTTGISTVGSHQPTLGGGQDAFVAAFNGSGTRVWGTYYGGPNTDDELGLASDASGNVYLVGYTASTAAMSTIGSHQPILGGGTWDGFLVQFAGCTGVPTTPGTISGTATICSGTANTYSITAVAGATSYTWTLPSGWTGTSTTNSINVTASATSGNVSVTANNACGNSSAATLSITVNSIPATPGTISGTATICSGTTNTYSITAVAGATSYTWTLPSGWTGTSTTNSINATASATSGNITVTANNTCGNSSAATLSITVNSIPATPGTISGTATICSGTTNTYSITAVAGATSYTWTLPGGWTGTSTTNSINATASATSGNITVTANNTCGNSTAQTLAVVVNSIPATPGTISGTATICSGTTNTYSIPAVAGATSYTWTMPSGWTGTSTTNSINVTASATSGNITVTANNTCGNSTAQTLAVVVNTIPTTPGTISGTSTICSGTTNTYSVTAVAGATSYTWTLPSGWTGTSTTNSINATASATSGNITVTANNACGNSTAQTLAVVVNTIPTTPGTISGTATICSGTTNTYSVTAVAGATSYTWTMPSGWTGTSTTNSINATASTTSGNITVTADNACGNSSAQTSAIVVNTTPTTPGTISGLASMCVGTGIQTYSITTIAGATSYTWTLPATWTGTSTTNSIVATPGTNGGNITVTANNTCGNSSPQTLAVIINPLPVVSYSQSPALVCINATSVALGTVSPTGGTFTGTAVTGSTFNASTAGTGTYSITYTYTDGNGCVNSANSNIVVDPCTGISQNTIDNEIVIFPNPTNGVIVIHAVSSSGVENKAEIIIYNVLGEIIYSTTTTSENTEIDLSKEMDGIYLIQITTKKGIVTKRIIKN